MKTIIEMAREAGFTERKLLRNIDSLKRFAELVLADERDRAMRENAYVLAEREACAKLCETTAPSQINGYECAAAIRARENI